MGLWMKKFLIASVLFLNISSVFAIGYQPVLSLSMAKKMAESCEKLAAKEGWKINIAIVDNGANLKFFIRQDDSFLKSIELAKQKGLPILLDFTAEWCGACQEMEEKTFPDERIAEISKNFVLLQVDGTVVRATVTALVQTYHWYRRVGVG